MSENEMIGRLLEMATWIWGIIAEEGFMRIATVVSDRLRPWRWPVIRSVLGRYRDIGVEWKRQHQAQTRVWRGLIGAMLVGLLMLFLSVAVHTFAVGEAFSSQFVAYYLGVAAFVGIVQVAMAVQLIRERLIPRLKARR